MFLYPFLQPLVTGIKYLLVIESKFGYIFYIMPV